MSTEKQRESYVERIYTKNGFTEENIFTEDEKVLHIGSGNKRLPGVTTVDILDLPGVDIVHDLDVIPWPFKDNEFDLIFTHSVFEHLEDQVALMEEMARVLKPGGRIIITVPHFRCVDAFTDSTHTHFFTTQSMDYYIEGKHLANYEYTKIRFKEIGFWFGWPQPSRNFLVRIFKSYIAKHPKFYDSHLSLFFPMKVIIWELEVIK